MGEPLSPYANQKTMLRDRLKLDKCDISYADLHSEVVKNTDNMASSSGVQSKQCSGSLAVENEEIVKHMSNLPSYLERGRNFQDKALNFGVMDWGRLEKWQCSQKQVPSKSSKGSPSSTNSSSYFSTDGSSSRSSRGHSCSPIRQKSHRPTLQSHFSASPQKILTPGDHLTEQKYTTRHYQAFHKTQMEIRLKECSRKDLESHSNPETKSSFDQGSSGMASSSKGKMKIQEDDSIKGQEELENRYYGNYDCHCVERQKTVVLLMPRDGPDRRTNDVRWVEVGSNFEEIHHLEHSITRRSCLESKVDQIKHSDIETSSFSAKSSSKPLPAPSSASVAAYPTRGKNQEEKSMSEKAPAIPTRTKNAEEKKVAVFEKVTASPSRTKNAEQTKSAMPSKDLEASKVRSISPLRRLSIGMSKIARSSTSRDSSVISQLSSNFVMSTSGSDRVEASAHSDNSTKVNPNASSRARSSPLRRFSSSSRDTTAIPQSNSKFVISKTCSDSAEVSACSDNLANGNPNVSSRARSSPLRRLLEPLFNSKATNSHQSGDPSPRDSKGKLRVREIGKDKLGRDEENESETMQALFQIAVKNGRPLFTFAVENNSDVLAATVRELNSSIKDGSEWMYTFFTVQEVKKKNTSWLNSSSKGKGHGYVPNIVAQMKVSDPSTSNREFVLFSVDFKQFDQQILKVNPRDELAAIIVQLPRKVNKDDHIDHFSTTVILPGGHHGLPSEGEPSPLIERWRSGGLCDCGGWDVGCRMRTLANNSQTNGKSSATQVHVSKNQFNLFLEGEFLGERPFFSMSPLKEGIYSVEFNSSLTILQAFSTCISVLDSRKSFQLSESSNISEEKSEEITTELKQEELPVRYVSYPPLSPVGRV